jgi:diketogulonate reductase-like aldo/keto reductase
MESCVRRGYTKHLGIANFNGQLLNEILSIATIKPVALQIECHPYLNQDGLINLAKKKGMQVLAHTALGKGLEL